MGYRIPINVKLTPQMINSSMLSQAKMNAPAFGTSMFKPCSQQSMSANSDVNIYKSSQSAFNQKRSSNNVLMPTDMDQAGRRKRDTKLMGKQMGLAARFEKINNSENNDNILIDDGSASSMSLKDMQHKELFSMLMPRLQSSVAPNSSPVLKMTTHEQVTPTGFNEDGSPAFEKASLTLAQLGSVTSMKDSTHHQLSDQ